MDLNDFFVYSMKRWWPNGFIGYLWHFLMSIQVSSESFFHSLSRREESCKNKLFACLYVRWVKKHFKKNIKIWILVLSDGLMVVKVRRSVPPSQRNISTIRKTFSIKVRLYTTASSQEWAARGRSTTNHELSPTIHIWEQTTTDDIHKCYAIFFIRLFVYQ